MIKGEREENRRRGWESGEEEDEKRDLNMDVEEKGYMGEEAGRREIFLF